MQWKNRYYIICIEKVVDVYNTGVARSLIKVKELVLVKFFHLNNVSNFTIYYIFNVSLNIL